MSSNNSSNDISVDDILKNSAFDGSDDDAFPSSTHPVPTPTHQPADTPSGAHSQGSSAPKVSSLGKPASLNGGRQGAFNNNTTSNTSHISSQPPYNQPLSASPDHSEQHHNQNGVLLDPSTSLDELNQFLDVPAVNMNETYQKHLRLFTHQTQSPPSHINQRLKQHLSNQSKSDQNNGTKDGDGIDNSTNSSKSGNIDGINGLVSSKSNNTDTQVNLFTLPKLSSISQQIEEKKQFTGVPTALSTDHRFICIGTSLGFVYVFDHFQARYGCLGTAKEHRQDTFLRGAVISLDTTPDGEHLIVGHRNGVVVLWELTPKSVLKIIDDFLLPVSLPNQQGITNVQQIVALPPPKVFTTLNPNTTASSSSNNTKTNNASVGQLQQTTTTTSTQTKEDSKHHITFLFCNTNGGVALVNVVKKFLLWSADIKWVMNNAEKPILHISLLPPTPLAHNHINNTSNVDMNSSLLSHPPQSTPPGTHAVTVEDHTLISLVFEERTMIVALEPNVRVIGVITRDFSPPPLATSAGLKFHPIIRPFGPVSTTWRASRPLTSISTAGVGEAHQNEKNRANEQNEQNEQNDDHHGDLVPSNAANGSLMSSTSLHDSTSPSSPSVANGSDYTQVYEKSIKSYYTGSRPYQVYSNYPLFVVSRGTLVQIFTAFDPQTLPELYRAALETQGTNAATQQGKEAQQQQQLAISMEKILIVTFPFEIISTQWVNDNTLLIFTQNNPGVPLDMAPPNPNGSVVVYALDASTLQIFEKMTIPSSTPTPLLPYRISPNQQSITYDRTYANSISTSFGQNAVCAVLGVQSQLNAIKMLGFLDRITSIADTDWLLALAIAYDTWLKAKRGGSRLLASRDSSKSSKGANNTGNTTLTRNNSSYGGQSASSSDLLGGFNVATGTLLIFDPSFMARCSLLGFIPAYDNLLVDSHEDGDEQLSIAGAPTTPSASSSSLMNSTPFGASNNKKSEKMVKNISPFAPWHIAHSILDANLFVLQHSFLENNSNSVAAMSLCDKIMDLLIFQVDLQLKKYTQIITEHTVQSTENGQNSQNGQNGPNDHPDPLPTEAHPHPEDLNDPNRSVSPFDDDNNATRQKFSSDEDAKEFSTGLITVLIQAVIDLTLKCNRSDILLKLILPRFVKTNNGILNTIRGYRDQGLALPNTLLSSFEETPSTQIVTIFLSHFFKIILSSHRNDLLQIDHTVAAHLQSSSASGSNLGAFGGHKSGIGNSAAVNNNFGSNSGANQFYGDNLSISRKLHYNRSRVLVIDDFLTDTTLSTLISQTKASLWLLQSENSLQRALHALHFNMLYLPGMISPSGTMALTQSQFQAALNALLPPPSYQMPSVYNPIPVPKIQKTGLITFELNIRSLMTQLRMLIINVHPIYMALLSTPAPQAQGPQQPTMGTNTQMINSNNYNTATLPSSQLLFFPQPTTSKFLNPVSYTAIYPLESNKLHADIQNSFTYPGYSGHYQIVHELYNSSNFIHSSTSSTSSLATITSSLSSLSTPGQSSNLLGSILGKNGPDNKRDSLSGLNLTQNISNFVFSTPSQDKTAQNPNQNPQNSQNPTPNPQNPTQTIQNGPNTPNLFNNPQQGNQNGPNSQQSVVAVPVGGLGDGIGVNQGQRERYLRSLLDTHKHLISSILQLVGQHLQNSIDYSYITHILLSLALAEEYLHLTQGLFALPMVSHRLLQQFGYLTNPGGSFGSHWTNSGSQYAIQPGPETPGKVYTTLHYLGWYLTSTSPFLSPYTQSLHKMPKEHPAITMSKSTPPSTPAPSQDLMTSQNEVISGPVVTTSSSLSTAAIRPKHEVHISHPLLTLLFSFFYHLSHGISFYDNVNLKFILPRLPLYHVRYAQQNLPCLFKLYCDGYDGQQQKMAQIAHQLSLSSHPAPHPLSSLPTSFPDSSQFGAVIAANFAMNSTQGEFINANTGLSLITNAQNNQNYLQNNQNSQNYLQNNQNNQNNPPTPHTNLSDFMSSPLPSSTSGSALQQTGLQTTPSGGLGGFATGYGGLMTHSGQNYPNYGGLMSQNASNSPGVVDTLLQYGNITTTSLFRAQIISFLFSPMTLTQFSHLALPHMVSQLSSTRYPYLYLFLNELDVATNINAPDSNNDENGVLGGSSDPMMKDFEDKFITKHLVPYTNNPKSLQNTSNPFFSLLIDLLGYPNWVVFSATATAKRSYKGAGGSDFRAQDTSNGQNMTKFTENGPNSGETSGIASSFIGTNVPSLKVQPATPVLPHIKQDKDNEKEKVQSKKEESTFGGWFSKMSNLVTATTTTTPDPAPTAPQPSNTTGQQGTVGKQSQGDVQNNNNNNNNNLSNNNNNNQYPSPQAIEPIYQSSYTPLLPSPIPSLITIIHALTNVIFARPHLGSNHNPYLSAFTYVLQKSDPKASLVLKSGIEDDFFLLDNIISLPPTANVPLLLSLVYHCLLTGLIQLSDLPPVLVVSLVSFACLAPDQQLLSIHLVNLSHSLGFFSLPLPFPELTQSDLYLIQQAPVVSPAVKMAQIQSNILSQNGQNGQNGTQNGSNLPSSPTLSQTYSSSLLGSGLGEPDRLAQVAQYLHTQRELLLLSLIPCVAETTKPSQKALSIATLPPQSPHLTTWVRDLPQKQRVQANVATLLSLAEYVSFSRALLSIYIQQKNFEKVLSSFLFITQPLLQQQSASNGNAVAAAVAAAASVKNTDLTTFTSGEVMTLTAAQMGAVNTIGNCSFDDAGLLDDGEKYYEDDEEEDDKGGNDPYAIPVPVKQVRVMDHNTKMISQLSKELLSYIAEELFSPLKQALNLETSTTPTVGASPPREQGFDGFITKLGFALKRIKQLLQICPLGVVALYIILTQALREVESTIQFQNMFFQALYNPKVNGADKSTLYLFLKHLLYCYDLYSAFNKSSDTKSFSQQQQLQREQEMDLDLTSEQAIESSSSGNNNGGKNSSVVREKKKREILRLLRPELFSKHLTPSHLTTLISDTSFTLPGIVSDQYIELLCQYEPRRVYHYLHTKQSYNLDSVLTLCKKFKIHDATAYLLERTGDLKGSLDLLFKVITQEAEQLQTLFHQFSQIFANRTLLSLSTLIIPALEPCIYTQDERDQLELDQKQPNNGSMYGRKSLLSATPIKPRRNEQNGQNGQNGQKGQNTMDFLQRQNKISQEKELNKIDFGPDNDIAHITNENLSQQYQAVMKNLLFNNNKGYANLLSIIPAKIRKYITYPVQMAISLCRRASDQSSSSKRLQGNGSGGAAGKGREGDGTVPGKTISIHLEDWEALWVDLLMLLIRIERSVAQTRVSNYQSYILPQLQVLPQQKQFEEFREWSHRGGSFANTPTRSLILNNISPNSAHLSANIISPAQNAIKASGSPGVAKGTSPQQQQGQQQVFPHQKLFFSLPQNDVVLILLHSVIISNISRVLNTMLEYIPADKVLVLAMKPYQNDHLSTFSTFFSLLFESIVYELSLRETTKRLLDRDHEVNTVQVLRRNNQCMNYTSPLQRLIKLQSRKYSKEQQPQQYQQLLQKERRIKTLQRQFASSSAAAGASQGAAGTVFGSNVDVEHCPLLTLQKALFCALCSKPIQNDQPTTNSHIVFFGCGHVFHDVCCEGIGGAIMAAGEAQGMTNVLLLGHRHHHQAHSNSHNDGIPDQAAHQCPTCLQRGLAQQDANINRNNAKAHNSSHNSPLSSSPHGQHDDQMAVTMAQNLLANFQRVTTKWHKTSGFCTFDLLSEDFSQIDDDAIEDFNQTMVHGDKYNDIDMDLLNQEEQGKSTNPFDEDLP